jgi:hypothetical protein
VTTPDHIRAHRHSSQHRDETIASELCGCFYRCETFPPSEIQTWVDEFALRKEETPVGQTALCPRCRIDAVIESESGYPLTPEFLALMRSHWFGTV